tara:strand:- start:332 stop:583 length:252 start_codon:yes stop_codon:yes gene_type:complete
MIELIKQHHPDMGDTEARSLINRALDNFAAETEIHETVFTQDTVAKQRYYTLADSVLRVKRCMLDNIEISRLRGIPDEDEDAI